MPSRCKKVSAVVSFTFRPRPKDGLKTPHTNNAGVDRKQGAASVRRKLGALDTYLSNIHDALTIKPVKNVNELVRLRTRSLVRHLWYATGHHPRCSPRPRTRRLGRGTAHATRRQAGSEGFRSEHSAIGKCW